MIWDEKKIRKGLEEKINKKTSLSDYYEVVGKKCPGRVNTRVMGLPDCLVADGPSLSSVYRRIWWAYWIVYGELTGERSAVKEVWGPLKQHAKKTYGGECRLSSTHSRPWHSEFRDLINDLNSFFAAKRWFVSLEKNKNFLSCRKLKSYSPPPSSRRLAHPLRNPDGSRVDLYKLTGAQFFKKF